MEPRRFFFIIALIVSFAQTSFISIPFLGFAPYLSACMSQDSLRLLLWRAFFLGLITDLFSTSFFFGSTGIIFMIISALLYKQKGWFFNDKIYTLSILTFCFSFSYTSIIHLMFYLQKLPLELSIQSIGSEFIFTPLLDALYAFVLFTLPESFYELIMRRKFAFKN